MERIPESKIEGIRSADFWIIDGKTRTRIEHKSMSKVEFTGNLEIDSNVISRGLSRKITRGRGQSPNIAVDVTKQRGITREIAERGIKRARGGMMVHGKSVKSIRIIGKGFDFTWTSKDWKN